MTDATVYVDVSLTLDLEAEGYGREVIRRSRRPGGSSTSRSRTSSTWKLR